MSGKGNLGRIKSIAFISFKIQSVKKEDGPKGRKGSGKARPKRLVAYKLNDMNECGGKVASGRMPGQKHMKNKSEYCV